MLQVLIPVAVRPGSARLRRQPRPKARFEPQYCNMFLSLHIPLPLALGPPHARTPAHPSSRGAFSLLCDSAIGVSSTPFFAEGEKSPQMPQPESFERLDKSGRIAQLHGRSSASRTRPEVDVNATRRAHLILPAAAPALLVKPRPLVAVFSHARC